MNLSAVFMYDTIVRLEQSKQTVRIFRSAGKILLTIPCLIGACLFFLLPLQTPDHYRTTDLKAIKVSLKKTPEFLRHGKSSTSLAIYPNEYGKLVFSPDYENFVHYSTDFERDVKKNDTIVLGLLIDDYKKYINDYQNFSNSYKKDNKWITVYYIAKNDRIYYHPTWHNALDQDDKKWAKYISPIGFVFIACIISIWFRKTPRFLPSKRYFRTAKMLIRLRRKRIL